MHKTEWPLEVQANGFIPAHVEKLWERHGYKIALSDEEREALKEGTVDIITFSYYMSRVAAWHEGNHNIWPYVNYLLYTFDELYDQFEERFSRLKAPRGEKTATVESVLNSMVRPFTIREIEFKCPGISRETIKSVLKNNPDCFECTGRGAGARWRRLKPIVASTSSEEDG